MRSIHAALATILLIGVTGCATNPSGTDAGDRASQGQPAGSTGPQPTAGGHESMRPEPSAGGAAGADCEERQIAASEAATEIHLIWESISYYVNSDEEWATETAPGGKVDVALYRTSIELIKDIPDPHRPTELGQPWSVTRDDAVRLADLLEQAAASGTPFADGIGDQIHTLGASLVSAQFGMHGAVDDMCYDPADELMAAGVEEMLAKLVPPNSTETSRTTSPDYSNFWYASTDSIDALANFYPSAIEATGYEATLAYDERPDEVRWNMTHPTKFFDWSVILTTRSDGSGTDVSITFTGEP